jgi:hypothetical protein
MPHPEEEAEKQEGHDVQGGSSHCARAKVIIPGPIMHVSTQRQLGDGAREGNRTLIFSLEVVEFRSAFKSHSNIFQLAGD